MDNENIEKNIVEEIIRDCRKINVEADYEFVKFYISLLKLDPNWKISDDIMHIRKDVQRFIKYVVQRLSHGDDPRIVTLQTQFYFDKQFDYLDEIARLNRKHLERELMPLCISILEPMNVNVAGLFERIVCYVTLLSGLGNPKSKEVHKEAETVMKSICTYSEIYNFMNVQYTTRKEILDKLVKISTGIRLYNLDCGRGGAQIPDLPNLLSAAIKAVKRKLMIVSFTAGIRLNWLTDVIESCYFVSNMKYKLTMDVKLTPHSTHSDLEYTKALCVLYMQHSTVLQILKKELLKIKVQTEKINISYHHLMNELHQKVIPNMPMRSSVVFPFFEKIADHWKQFQDQILILMALKNTLQKQDLLVRSLKFETSVITNYRGREEKDKEGFDIDCREFRQPIHKEVLVVKENLLDFWSKVNFEFGGYCCWKLILSQGVLTKGDQAYGVVNFRNCFYQFSSPLGLKSFAIDPEYFINHTIEMARRNCELIPFLNIKPLLIKNQLIDNVCQKESSLIETHESCTTTDTHIIPRKIDTDYTSNVWELKRRAISFANMMHFRTVACQTMKSNAVSTSTQIYGVKEKSIQTKSDNYSNTPTILQKITGLRGRRDFRQEQVNMTFYDFKQEFQNKNI